MPITVHGASGDLIEVDGDAHDTFRYTGKNDAGDLLTFSDGTVLAMRPDPELTWVIDVVAHGAGDLETWHHTREGDQARVHGATWVSHGTNWAKVSG